MAESRLCGYCRVPGHRKPDCPTFLEHRKLVLTHTPQQRKAFVDAMCKVGLGIGAMCKIDDYMTGENSIALIRNFDYIQHCNFIDVRQVKYSKQVKITPLRVAEDYEYRGIYVNALVMGNGKSHERNIRVNITAQLKRHAGTLLPNHYEYERTIDIQAPSYDCDYDPETLVTNVEMPRRLLIGGEVGNNVRGIMPE